MKKSKSLRFRITFAFTAFALVLGVIFTFFIIISMHFAQQVVVRAQLEEGVNFWKIQHGERANPPTPALPFLKGYAGLDLMPEDHRALVTDLPDGIHKLSCGSVVPLRDTWVSVFEHHGKRYYFFYYVTNYLRQDAQGSALRQILLAGIFVITLIGFGLGKLTAHTVVRPVIDLAHLVDTTDPNDLPERLATARSFSNDEVGFLAARLGSALKDVEAYHQREQRFTRYASHELRTPVAVLKGAAELLVLTQPDLQRSRPMGRIQRSVEEMERLIATFLALARQETVVAEQPTDVVEVVQDAVERQREQLGARQHLALSLQADGAPRVQAPDTVVRVLVDNLLANAVRHTDRGEVGVIVDQESISVWDEGPGIPESDLVSIRREYVRGKDSQGYGLGLAIVEDLCKRYNWSFELRNRDTRGLIACLRFAPPAQAA